MGVWVAARPIRATRPSQPRPSPRPRASASRTLQVGTLLLGRKYSFLEYVASAGLVTGIVFFTMGDAEARPSFNPIGIVPTLAVAVALALALALSRHPLRGGRASWRHSRPASSQLCAACTCSPPLILTLTLALTLTLTLTCVEVGEAWSR